MITIHNCALCRHCDFYCQFVSSSCRRIRKSLNSKKNYCDAKVFSAYIRGTKFFCSRLKISFTGGKLIANIKIYLRKRKCNFRKIHGSVSPHKRNSSSPSAAQIMSAPIRSGADNANHDYVRADSGCTETAARQRRAPVRSAIQHSNLYSVTKDKKALTESCNYLMTKNIAIETNLLPLV